MACGDKSVCVSVFVIMLFLVFVVVSLDSTECTVAACATRTHVHTHTCTQTHTHTHPGFPWVRAHACGLLACGWCNDDRRRHTHTHTQIPGPPQTWLGSASMLHCNADNAPITLNYSEEWTLNCLNRVCLCMSASLSMHLSWTVVKQLFRFFTSVKVLTAHLKTLYYG